MGVLIMRKLLIIFAIFLPMVSMFGQSQSFIDSNDLDLASDVSFTAYGESVAITYTLGVDAYVELYVSLDGGQSFIGPLAKVKGSVGWVKGGKRSKMIYWYPMKEFGGIESDEVVFRVLTRINSELHRQGGRIAQGGKTINASQLDSFVGDNRYHREYIKAQWNYYGGVTLLSIGVGSSVAFLGYGLVVARGHAFQEPGFWIIESLCVGCATLGAFQIKKGKKRIDGILEGYRSMNYALNIGTTNNGLGLTFVF